MCGYGAFQWCYSSGHPQNPHMPVGLANTYLILENDMVAAKASMDAKQKYERSPYVDEEEEEEAVGETQDHYLLWIRGSWFPPSKKDDVGFDGKVPPHLFSSPLKL